LGNFLGGIGVPSTIAEETTLPPEPTHEYLLDFHEIRIAGTPRHLLSFPLRESGRLAAIHALARASAEQAPSLVPLLTNQDHRVRAAAAYSACQLRLKDAVPGVAALAADPDPEVRQAAIDAMSLWPEAFNKELVAIASNPKESEDNRILGLTALDASSAGQKNAALVKSISSLLDVEQPPDVQIASVQLLSQVPEARGTLEQFSKRPGMRPEVLDRMETLGIRVQPTEIQGKEVNGPFQRVVDDHSAAWFGLAGVFLGGLLALTGNLLLEVLKQRAKKKRDEPRKQLLRKMLEDERFEGRWRELETLMHVIGADAETTKRLLIEIGARGSEDREDLWGLIKYHPFGKKD
jgi:HEAT repeats